MSTLKEKQQIKDMISEGGPIDSPSEAHLSIWNRFKLWLNQYIKIMD